ncbi:hypothetical protein SUNI508_07780 [Seiridium unicorne]|uniref:Uncharacterized protein n=1 Tax=Seiridium unicorne TaxID=138068 RepID=A0ABR2UVQ5_9PEZI
MGLKSSLAHTFPPSPEFNEGDIPALDGSLVFLHLDLNDLRNAKAAAESFLAQEQRLHGLFNNVGLRLQSAQVCCMSDTRESIGRTTFSRRNGRLVIGVEARSYAVCPERILQIVAAAATVLVSTVSLAPNAVWPPPVTIAIHAKTAVVYNTSNAWLA